MKLSIDNPCSEDWSKMTPTEKGAFCKQCSKEVIDFRGKNSLEIRDLLIEGLSGKGSTCGRFHQYQLDQFNEEFIEWKDAREEVRAVWLVSALIVFGFTLFSCQNNLSKEVVNQMQVKGMEMLVEDSVQTEQAEVFVETKEVDVIPDTLATSGVYPILPLEMDVMGTVPWIYEPKCKIEIGELIGVGVVYGDWISIPVQLPEEHPLSPMLAQFETAEPIVHVPNVFGVDPEVPQPQPTNLNGILSGRNEDFEAYIEGEPVNEDSRLVLITSTDMDLIFTLLDLDNRAMFSSERLSFNMGTHRLHLRGNLLPAGNYEMRLASLTKKENLPFEVVV